MEELLSGIANGLELFVKGLLDVIGMFGADNLFIVAIILLVVAFLARKIPTAAGDITFAVLVAVVVYVIVLAFGMSEWLGMVLGTAALGWGMYKLAGRAKASQDWIGLGLASFLLVCAVLAELSFLSTEMPQGQLERDFARGGKMIGDFIEGFFNGATSGADKVSNE